MTLQMDDNRKYQPHEWLLVQKTEYNKETKSRLMLTYGDFSKLMEQMDDGEVLPAKVREGVAVMLEQSSWLEESEGRHHDRIQNTFSGACSRTPEHAIDTDYETGSVGLAAGAERQLQHEAAGFLKTPSAPFGLGLQRSERPKEGRTPGNLDSPLGRTGLMMTEPQCLKFDGCSRTGSTGLIFGD
eukprot:CAMPEP_0115099082 /NCGR_PEP_ID=MMETSP0227-20121206/31615_1 /TAXON_ID=89957 /ORGANISM="Polarella glacialis, Strain CCMP 1383" /LENGTH=184 /DNA_ID=CAMNT_0002493955 /DNA_START=83 /DNA_END=638 /DNA_ORIENTATION=-